MFLKGRGVTPHLISSLRRRAFAVYALGSRKELAEAEWMYQLQEHPTEAQAPLARE